MQYIRAELDKELLKFEKLFTEEDLKNNMTKEDWMNQFIEVSF